ncbi:galactose-1-epimerase [Alginatibacterium sediminis]|uniref:Aldose 1-epimerase n=2 Tax=Alginatibacterium sediminis TaxID=2164068 RepID=A0A420EA42_9ALTE|nr:galactose-1-epimerase [Alginatibacterium sediminis]
MTKTPAIDGKIAKIVHLSNSNGMTASFMDIGATWLSCRLLIENIPREILLRSPNMEEHKKQSAYFGSIIGRYANRIDKGQFYLNGSMHHVGTNESANSLHGGFIGFDKRRWEIDSHSASSILFSLLSVAGDEGYPGNLNVQVCYTLTESNEIKIEYRATSDESTPLSLTNHAYFNLAGENSTAKSLNHRLKINASHYLPTRDDLIPTGEVRSTLGTSFDFNTKKLIAADFLNDDDQKTAGGYDHAFVLSGQPEINPAVAATLSSPEDDVQMHIVTSMPSIQFYSGNVLAGTPGASKEYQNYDGIALEPQFLPDGPNHVEWGTNMILKYGDVYEHQTCYQFLT